VARLQPPQHVCHVGVARVEEGGHDGAWVQHKNGVLTPLLLFDTPVAAFTFQSLTLFPNTAAGLQ